VLSLEGLPLDGVEVRTEFGATTTTDGSGSYALPYPIQTALSYSYVVAGNKNYEIARSPFNRNTEQAQLQPVRLQPRLDFSDGSLSSDVSKVDLTYFTGEPYESDVCSPCKRIRLHSDKARTLLMTLDWSGATPVHLWVWVGSPAEPELPHMESGTVVTDIPALGGTQVTVQITAYPGDTVIHVGLPYNRAAAGPSSPIPFTLSVRPG
jgi:hypothetical protein